jgi:hypothetical protein
VCIYNTTPKQGSSTPIHVLLKGQPDNDGLHNGPGHSRHDADADRGHSVTRRDDPSHHHRPSHGLPWRPQRDRTRHEPRPPATSRSHGQPASRDQRRQHAVRDRRQQHSQFPATRICRIAPTTSDRADHPRPSPATSNHPTIARRPAGSRQPWDHRPLIDHQHRSAETPWAPPPPPGAAGHRDALWFGCCTGLGFFTCRSCRPRVVAAQFKWLTRRKQVRHHGWSAPMRRCICRCQCVSLRLFVSSAVEWRFPSPAGQRLESAFTIGIEPSCSVARALMIDPGSQLVAIDDIRRLDAGITIASYVVL